MLKSRLEVVTWSQDSKFTRVLKTQPALQKTDKKLIERCIRELYILSKSCPQPSMVEAAKEMLYHKGPPPPPPQPAAPAGPTSRFRSASRNRPSSPVDAISGLPVVGAPTKKLKGGKKKRKDPFDL